MNTSPCSQDMATYIYHAVRGNDLNIFQTFCRWYIIMVLSIEDDIIYKHDTGILLSYSSIDIWQEATVKKKKKEEENNSFIHLRSICNYAKSV